VRLEEEEEEGGGGEEEEEKEDKEEKEEKDGLGSKSSDAFLPLRGYYLVENTLE